jgi:hypothetical protein
VGLVGFEKGKTLVTTSSPKKGRKHVTLNSKVEAVEAKGWEVGTEGRQERSHINRSMSPVCAIDLSLLVQICQAGKPLNPWKQIAFLLPYLIGGIAIHLSL